MNFTVDEINHIRLENPNSLTAQSFMLLKKWVCREGKNATSKSILIYENITLFSSLDWKLIYDFHKYIYLNLTHGKNILTSCSRRLCITLCGSPLKIYIFHGDIIFCFVYSGQKGNGFFFFFVFSIADALTEVLTKVNRMDIVTLLEGPIFDYGNISGTRCFADDNAVFRDQADGKV